SIAINSKEWYIDQIHILMILSAQVYFEEKDDNLNFSSFKRPPPLSQRTSGKLLTLVLASIVISLAYPGYQLGYDYLLQIKLNSQKKVFTKLNKKTSAIKRELANIKSAKKKVNILLKKESKKFEFRKKLLNEIYVKKISYPMKALILSELFKISNKYKSKIISADFKDGVLVLDIQNRSDKKITEFIQDLTKLNKYKINTDKIVKDNKKRRYLSKISIGIDNEK
ncbi:MAG: hypothetical protein GXP61_09200, partial [Epsilonproteobacteria bacterium]|nr:hypothetical protein [Campylobacterota bacterium]